MTTRRSWEVPLGKAIGLGAAAAGAALVLAGLLIGGVLAGDETPAALRFGVTAAMVVGGLGLLLFSRAPVRTVTVGTRGIGLRGLGRHRFVDYGSLRAAHAEDGRLRLETSSGKLRVSPRIAEADRIVDHIETMRVQRDAT